MPAATGGPPTVLEHPGALERLRTGLGGGCRVLLPLSAEQLSRQAWPARPLALPAPATSGARALGAADLVSLARWLRPSGGALGSAQAWMWALLQPHHCRVRTKAPDYVPREP